MGKDTKVAMGVVLIAIAITVIIFFSTRAKNQESGKEDENTTEVTEEYVNVLSDGTKLNTSSNLHKTKTIDEMEISNIQLTENNNVTLLLGTITNTSTVEQGGYSIDIKIVDKNGKEITTFPGYIKKLQPGESTQLSSNQTIDCANAYDFIISKAK